MLHQALVRHLSVFIIYAAILALRPTDAAAIKVAPQLVFIPSGAKGGELILRNADQNAVEVTVEILFGYETANDQGKVNAFYPKDASMQERSAAAWVRAYPKKMRLNPSQEQVVRFLIRRPRNLPAGEYWARASVMAVPILPPPKTPPDHPDKLQIQLGVTADQRVPIFVRHGEVSASPKIREVKPRITSDSSGKSVELLYKVETHGGGAFLGQARAQLLDSKGKILGETTKNLAVFETGFRNITVTVLADNLGPEKKLRTRLVTLTSHPGIQGKYLLPGTNDKWEQDLVFP